METFDDAHVFRMTDDTGMFQHALFSVPNRLEGYTTDDNARALIMAVMLYESEQKPEYLALVTRYLSFVLHSQNETGRFRNFMTYNREFKEKDGSEDCFGRCLWALGYAYASSVVPSGIKESSIGAIQRALPTVHTITWARGQAYALIGLCLISNPAIEGLIGEVANSLFNRFEQEAGDKEWQWFEEHITYDNAVFPWALFAAYKCTGQDRLIRVATESLAFLDRVTFRDGFFRAVGCNGWFMRGAGIAQYDEQPLEACTTTLAHLAAYEATGDAKMLESARQSFSWYLGANSRHESLIDPETGGCNDGIMSNGLNQNQGAESIVGYTIAGLALTKSMATAKDKVQTDEARISMDEKKAVNRPWGFYVVMDSEPGFKTKKIVVNPGQILSLQMHYHRSEHWIVVGGTAKVTIGEIESIVHENESVFIPQTVKHRIENPGLAPLKFIEVQNGNYLGEDDIVRFEDKYGRVAAGANDA